MNRENIYKMIDFERASHQVKWRDYKIRSFDKMIVLVMEELGEAIKERHDTKKVIDNHVGELIQTISLIVSYLEGIE